MEAMGELEGSMGTSSSLYLRTGQVFCSMAGLIYTFFGPDCTTSLAIVMGLLILYSLILVVVDGFFILTGRLQNLRPWMIRMVMLIDLIFAAELLSDASFSMAMGYDKKIKSCYPTSISTPLVVLLCFMLVFTTGLCNTVKDNLDFDVKIASRGAALLQHNPPTPQTLQKMKKMVPGSVGTTASQCLRSGQAICSISAFISICFYADYTPFRFAIAIGLLILHSLIMVAVDSFLIITGLANRRPWIIWMVMLIDWIFAYLLSPAVSSFSIIRGDDNQILSCSPIGISNPATILCLMLIFVTACCNMATIPWLYYDWLYYDVTEDTNIV